MAKSALQPVAYQWQLAQLMKENENSEKHNEAKNRKKESVKRKKKETNIENNALSIAKSESEENQHQYVAAPWPQLAMA